jgi:hypothetical protein
MPKDTIWINYNEETYLFEFNTESAINTRQFYKTIENIGDNIHTAYAFNGQIDEKKDSIIKIIMANDINVYNKKNENGNFVEYVFLLFTIIILGLVLIYALKKRKQYIANPNEAEAKEKWEEIGTSNNYDTTGAGGFGGIDIF